MNSLESFLSNIQFPYKVFDKNNAASIYKPRDPFGNKGTYGHALLLAGSYGKMGAALLASKACLCAGSGLLTTHVPVCGYEIMQSTVPEAMVSVDSREFHLSTLPEHIETYRAAGIGPGIGKHEETEGLLNSIIEKLQSPVVFDADALNIISNYKDLLEKLKPGSILTPHPKEFDRLFGDCRSDNERIEKAKLAAEKHKIVIVLKGHFTIVFDGNGELSVNTTGNAGMAKGGSGDALTGIITALLAQSYTPQDAGKFGVFLHGLAGDIAAEIYSQEAMLASDLINCLGKAFLLLKN